MKGNINSVWTEESLRVKEIVTNAAVIAVINWEVAKSCSLSGRKNLREFK